MLCRPAFLMNRKFHHIGLRDPIHALVQRVPEFVRFVEVALFDKGVDAVQDALRLVCGRARPANLLCCNFRCFTFYLRKILRR